MWCFNSLVFIVKCTLELPPFAETWKVFDEGQPPNSGLCNLIQLNAETYCIHRWQEVQEYENFLQLWLVMNCPFQLVEWFDKPWSSIFEKQGGRIKLKEKPGPPKWMFKIDLWWPWISSFMRMKLSPTSARVNVQYERHIKRKAQFLKAQQSTFHMNASNSTLSKIETSKLSNA